MAKIKFDMQTLNLMSYFEKATGSKLKDCFVDGSGTLTFVVQDGIQKAIGKNGSTFRKLEKGLKRKIRIFSYSEDLGEFIANMLLPLRAKDIECREDGTVVITPEQGSRGYMIGRAAQNLRNYESIVRRYFDVREIRVV